MKAVTVYDSIDGKRFKTEAECLRYEELLTKFNEVWAILPEAIDEDCKFANGHGYVQHCSKSLREFRNRAEILIAEYASKETADSFSVNPRGIAGRILDDGDTLHRKLSEFAWRFFRIDGLDREWGQAYYAYNPDKGDQTPWLNVKPSKA